MSGPENTIQKQILEAFKKLGIFCWRNNTGMVKTRHGSFVHYGKVGSGDIIGLVGPAGKFLSVEVKAPKGIASPEQIEFRETIRNAGGIAIVAESLNSAITQLESAMGGNFLPFADK